MNQVSCNVNFTQEDKPTNTNIKVYRYPGGHPSVVVDIEDSTVGGSAHSPTGGERFLSLIHI